MEFSLFWKLYMENFPSDERRQQAEQLELMEDPRYQVAPIYFEDRIVGFNAYWSLDGFFYIEHMAIEEWYKGRGIGTVYLQTFLKKHSRVVLEVLPPGPESAPGRIPFYERLGFHVNPYPYMMPKLSEQGNALPLVVLSYPRELTPQEFAIVRNELYGVVYKVKPESDQEEFRGPNP